MSAKRIMIQGTGSSVGKSLLVTALCRHFARAGLKVAPFKSQNMSLNSFITPDGKEMGRAQVAQAEAAGRTPDARMNPVLLKPCGDKTSQVIVNGTVRDTMDARAFYAFRHTLKVDIYDAFSSLAAENDLIIIEGAGSPAEINLRENDIANMGMADLANAPVLLAGDIDKGGVFAQLYGTVKLLEPQEQQRIAGYIINKFRGDESILFPGIKQLSYILAKPCLGVIPYLDVVIDEEDSMGLAASRHHANGGYEDCSATAVDIAVIRLPRMSNFTDFAVFNLFPDVRLRYVERKEDLGHPDMLILPGTKNTLTDMRHLHESGLAEAIRARHTAGAAVFGICGGYQMLGGVIHDPQGVESDLRTQRGIGLLPITTSFLPQKTTVQRTAIVNDHHDVKSLLNGTAGLHLRGYEIHIGVTQADAQDSSASPCSPFALTEEGVPEGLTSPDGRVVGTYLHGVFDNIPFTAALLRNLVEKRIRSAALPRAQAPLRTPPFAHYADFKEQEYDRLADAVTAHLDMKTLSAIAGLHE